MNQVKFIHCADLHLDSPFKGLSDLPVQIFEQVRNSTFKSFNKLVEKAIDEHVDFVLMAGDIFDQEEQSLQAYMTFVRACQKLAEHDILVYLSFGNHDPINSQTFPRHFPDNVFVFEKEQVESFPFNKNNQTIATIHGFSYINRAVYENKISQFQNTRDACFSIGMLHGSMSQMMSEEHAPYAPFQLQELKQAGFDYWALGHIHKRNILSQDPPVVYPGNLQGRSIKETGEKGCYVVTLSENDCDLTFVPLQEIRFEKLSVDVSSWTNMTQASEKLDQIVLDWQKMFGRVFVELHLINISDKVRNWIEEGWITDLIDIIHDKIEDSFSWVYIMKVKIEQSFPNDPWQEGESFLNQIHQSFQEVKDFSDLISPLWHHKDGRKWLEKLDEQEKKEILQEAEESIYKALLEGRD
ncbi:DNA repair exonuclease [Gracilibacillus sp. YIM 98692]|uniref:metallophosphoesterase family protein n=1 Tax=Gracilibacillus sp. YIM 98692 TaxID=2663532 RepID=UPI0013D81BF1|nr:DNA repair exonuclease [Gracilibacillus sp. YIM 98692]